MKSKNEPEVELAVLIVFLIIVSGAINAGIVTVVSTISFIDRMLVWIATFAVLWTLWEIRSRQAARKRRSKSEEK